MKSGFPYLVDIKMTQYCPFGCSFCYQSSTKEGKHAENYTLYTLARLLKSGNVLEVNFGGGEPTLYNPTKTNTLLFSDIVKDFKSQLFRVGVTTKNYRWHKQPDFEKATRYIDSVAVSINSFDEFEKSKELAQSFSYITEVYAQIIFGLLPWNEFKAFVETIVKTSRHSDYFYPIYKNITFLGFKDFGFSSGFVGHQYPIDWIDWIKDLQATYKFNLGVDSIMVKNWKQELIDHDVSPTLLVGREGSSSCYIDAVEKKIYSSSFSHEQGVDIPYDAKDFIKIFREL